MAKPTRLKYTGAMIDRGDGRKEPDRFFYGVPARDLDEADIAALDSETLKNITGGDDPLYVEAGGDGPRDMIAEKPAVKGKGE